MNRLLNIVILLFLAVVGIPLLVIGGLFAWNQFTLYNEANFVSPSEEKVLRVREDCSFSNCTVSGLLEYRLNGKMNEMSCKPLARGHDRFLFEDRPKIEWGTGELKVFWTEDSTHTGEGAPLSGELDITTDCYHQVAHVERGRPVNFRFRENCLGAGCSREILLWYSGTDYLFVPCKVTLDDPRLIFSTGNDHEPNMEVTYDDQAKTAQWRSLLTGVSGVLDLKADCDTSRQWREPAPPG